MPPATALNLVIDKLYAIVVEQPDGRLRGNRLKLLYDALPAARDVVRREKLPRLCDASNGRLKFERDDSSGTVVAVTVPPAASRPPKRAREVLTLPEELAAALGLLSCEVAQDELEGRMFLAGLSGTERALAEAKNETILKTAGAKLPWTDEPNIPEPIVAALVALVEEPDVSRQLNVHSRSNYEHEASHVRGMCFEHGLEKREQYLLLREAQKGTSDRNKEKVYADEDLVKKMRCLVGANPPLLLAQAWRLNVGTTHLGIALAGQPYLDAVIDNEVEEESRATVVEGEDPTDAANRTNIARAVVKYCPNDTISGFLCESRNSGHSDDMKVHAQRMNVSAQRGENLLKEDLDAAGLQGLYTTQRDNVQSEFDEREKGDRSTPDVLFDTPIAIIGKKVNWIDVKHDLVIPGVTPERRMKKLRCQVERYVARFGPGAVLWTKLGFCKDVLPDVEGVAHFRPKDRPMSPQFTSQHMSAAAQIVNPASAAQSQKVSCVGKIMTAKVAKPMKKTLKAADKRRNINARSKNILRFCDLGHMRGNFKEMSYRDRIGESLASMYGTTFAKGSWWYENPDEDKFFAALFQRASGKPMSQGDVAEAMNMFFKRDKWQIKVHEPTLRKVGLSKEALREMFCVTKAAGGKGVVEIPQPGNQFPRAAGKDGFEPSHAEGMDAVHAAGVHAPHAHAHEQAMAEATLSVSLLGMPPHGDDTWSGSSSPVATDAARLPQQMPYTTGGTVCHSPEAVREQRLKSLSQHTSPPDRSDSPRGGSNEREQRGAPRQVQRGDRERGTGASDPWSVLEDRRQANIVNLWR